jgi:hypothetical protein
MTNVTRIRPIPLPRMSDTRAGGDFPRREHLHRAELEITRDLLTVLDSRITALTLAAIGCEALHGEGAEMSALVDLAVDLQSEIRDALLECDKEPDA